jgi:hypothetical protein
MLNEWTPRRVAGRHLPWRLDAARVNAGTAGRLRVIAAFRRFLAAIGFTKSETECDAL